MSPRFFFESESTISENENRNKPPKTYPLTNEHRRIYKHDL